MAGAFEPFDFTGIIVALDQSWQSLHATGRRTMRFSGRIFYAPDEFLISEASKLNNYPVEFSLVQGVSAEQKVEHGLGKVAFLSDVGEGLLNAWYCVPDSVFNELWHRFSCLDRDVVHVSLTIGPIERNDADEIIWNRSKQKALFITEAEITFRKELAARAD
jgi:hypothetical protein